MWSTLAIVLGICACIYFSWKWVTKNDKNKPTENGGGWGGGVDNGGLPDVPKE